MGRTRTKSLASVADIPQTDEQCRAQIRELGDVSRQITRLETELADKTAKLKQGYGDKAAPLNDRLVALQTGIQTYCEANRDRLTNGGKVKSHDFVTGIIQWRNRPPKVKLTGVADVLDRLIVAKLDRFVRTKSEPNKEAMLDDPEAAEAIEGVKIVTGAEEFIVEPSETALAEAS